MFLLLHFSLQNLVLSSSNIFHLPYCPYQFSALPPQDPWSVLSARVDIPGLLSVNDIYELGKETFQCALFRIFKTCLLHLGIVVWLSNFKGGGGEGL